MAHFTCLRPRAWSKCAQHPAAGARRDGAPDDVVVGDSDDPADERVEGPQREKATGGPGARYVDGESQQARDQCEVDRPAEGADYVEGHALPGALGEEAHDDPRQEPAEPEQHAHAVAPRMVYRPVASDNHLRVPFNRCSLSRRGDVARALLYMDLRYDGSDSGTPDLELLDRTTSIDEQHFGHLCTVLVWHEEDHVDDAERRRNDVIFAWQGNRNPFVDHPEWVQSIWALGCE
jgi:hypothetical protein